MYLSTCVLVYILVRSLTCSCIHSTHTCIQYNPTNSACTFGILNGHFFFGNLFLVFFVIFLCALFGVPLGVFSPASYVLLRIFCCCLVICLVVIVCFSRCFFHCSGAFYHACPLLSHAFPFVSDMQRSRKASQFVPCHLN